MGSLDNSLATFIGNTNNVGTTFDLTTHILVIIHTLR
jgi:hypothetical protein